MKNKYPKYKFGIKFNKDNAVDLTRNSALFVADNALSGLGLNNVVGEESYRGESAEKFGRASNITGGITKGVMPIGAGIAGAALGMAVGQPVMGAKLGYTLGKGTQNAFGNLNPEDETGGNEAYMKSQNTANKIVKTGDSLGSMGINSMGMIAPFLGGQPQGQEFNFAFGGMNKAPNAEVEGGENSITPNGEFTQYNGPSHENGGIKTNLENGEMIFSDRLKMPGTKKTFAQLNKVNNTSKEDKVIEDKKSNNLQKMTAEIMKQAKMIKSNKLFNEQEQFKQSKLDNYAKRLGVSGESYKYGGIKKLPKFLPGGEFGDNDPALPDEFGNTYTDKVDTTGSDPNYLNDQFNLNMYSQEERDMLSGKDIPLPNKMNPAYLNAAKQLGLGLTQNMGNLYDLKRSNTYDIEKYNRVTPELLNGSEDLKYNRMVGKMMGQNIRNASGGNASTYLANMKDLAINQMLTNSRIKMNYDNSNAQIKNQASYYNAGIGDKETIANLANQAQARNLKSSAYTNIGQNVSSQYKDIQLQKANEKFNQNMATSQNDYLRILTSKYPEILKDPDLAKMFQI